MFITTSLEPRRNVLGDVAVSHVDGPDGGLSARQVLSPAGLTVEAALLETPRFVPGIALKKYVIMPDHVHLLVYLVPGLEAPLKSLGRFMAGFKRVAAKRAGIKWQSGYHDRICISADFRRKVEAYIEQNPLKWALMHGAECRVREPLESHALDPDDWWRGLGAIDLLEGLLCSMRISRRVDVAQLTARIGGLTARHREPTRAGSLLLNDKIAAMAYASGGVALYLLPEGLQRITL